MRYLLVLLMALGGCSQLENKQRANNVRDIKIEVFADEKGCHINFDADMDMTETGQGDTVTVDPSGLIGTVTK